MAVDAVWQQALCLLEQEGLSIDAHEQRVVDAVRRDFENVSKTVEDKQQYETEGPGLAAWMVSYALETSRLGLTEYESCGA